MLAGAKSLRDYTNIRYAVQEPNAASLINSISSSATSAQLSSATPASGAAAAAASTPFPGAPPPIPPSRESSGGGGAVLTKNAIPGGSNIPMDIDSNGFSCNN